MSHDFKLGDRVRIGQCGGLLDNHEATVAGVGSDLPDLKTYIVLLDQPYKLGKTSWQATVLPRSLLTLVKAKAKSQPKVESEEE